MRLLEFAERGIVLKAGSIGVKIVVLRRLSLLQKVYRILAAFRSSSSWNELFLR